MLAIREIAERRDLPIIEDACEAIGATVAGRPAGGWGETGVFAFYPNKQLTTGEGGIIVTNSERIAALCRSWRNQGRGEDGAWLQHERLGYNYRLSDINCALGVAQVRRLKEILSKREHVASLYHRGLQDCPELILPAMDDPNGTVSWFVYVVRLTGEFSQADRDRVLSSLRAEGIGCSNYFSPIHLQPFYRRQFGFARGDFPVTEAASERTIALPFFTGMRESQVRRVCTALRRALSAGSRSRVALAAEVIQ